MVYSQLTGQYYVDEHQKQEFEKEYLGKLQKQQNKLLAEQNKLLKENRNSNKPNNVINYYKTIGSISFIEFLEILIKCYILPITIFALLAFVAYELLVWLTCEVF